MDPLHAPSAAFAPSDLRAIDDLLDRAVRHAGLQLVEPVADLIRSIRDQHRTAGVVTFSPPMLEALALAADAAARGGGLAYARLGLQLLDLLQGQAPPASPDADTLVEPIVDFGGAS